MHILRRWSMRMVLEDRIRALMVILAMISVFAIWVSADFLVISTIQDAGGLHEENTFGITIPSLVSYLQNEDLSFWEGLSGWFNELVKEPFSGNLLTNSLFRALCNYLYGGLLIGMCIIMYSVFSVTADECLQDYRVLTSSGATARQIRRSLLQRAIALSLIGAVFGTAVGLLTAWMTTDPDLFRKVITKHFFTDRRTQLMMLVSMLSAPCTMALATRFAFWRRQQRRAPRVPKHGVFRRHPFAWRLFGVGGVLGGMSSSKNIRYRVMFTASFAICLAMLAQLNNLLVVFQDLKPLLDTADPAGLLAEADDDADDVNPLGVNFDLRIECESGSRTDILNTLLRKNADRIGIERSMTFYEPTAWKDCSCALFDCDWMNEWYVERGQTVKWDGRQMLLWKSLGFAFIDDASFDQIAQKKGIGSGIDGAIFCNFRYFNNRKRVAPLKTMPDRNVTLFFLNGSLDAPEYENMSDAEFLRKAAPAAEIVSIRILGETKTVPYALDFDRPTLLFPERMFASFASLLTGSEAAFYDMKTTYFLALPSDPDEAVAAAKKKESFAVFEDLVMSDPRLNDEYEKKMFGLDERETDGQEKDKLITANDMQDLRDRLQIFQNMLPRFEQIVVVMVALGLYVGILNTAHMNRMTRRRAKAILDSLGMGKREKTGMLLYESARYALNSIVLGWLLFTVIFFPIWGDYQDLLWDNALRPQSRNITLRVLLLNGTTDDWKPYLQAFGNAFKNTWWIFVGGAVLIFALLILADWMISRIYRREELIQILKDDTGSDGWNQAL